YARITRSYPNRSVQRRRVRDCRDATRARAQSPDSARAQQHQRAWSPAYRSVTKISELADQFHNRLQILAESSSPAHVRAACHVRNDLAELNLPHGPVVHPLPTALMGEYPTNALAVSLFGVVMAVNTLLFIALQSYILRNLIKPEMADTVVPHLTRKSFVGVASYLLGVAATFFNVHLAFVLYALTPLFFITPPQPRRSNL